MSREDGASGRRGTGRNERERSAQSLAHSRRSILFGLWSSIPGQEVLTMEKPRLRQVYKVVFAGWARFWFVPEFPCLNSWHGPTAQQKLAEGV